MRDINDGRTVAREQEQEEPGQGWWFKGLLFVAAVLMTLAHFGLQRSIALEHAAVGVPSIGELVQRDKPREQMLLEEHYKYRSYETHSDDDRAGLTAIIAGGE